MEINKINCRNWELLMNAVEEKRVVPIIGENLIQVNTQDNDNINIRNYVLKELSSHFNSGEICKDYSQAEDVIREYNRRHNAGDITDIYYEIYDILSRTEIIIPDFLIRFVRLCKFPLILTTSYARGIDKILDIPSIKIYNKKISSDIKISELEDGTSILYYLFGCLNMAKRSFKVTEDDLLDYLHCWHNSDTRPIKLGEYLSDKFLLILGCDYPNWLFRFFWHSIKNFNIFPYTADMQGVVTVSDDRIKSDSDLMYFLSRVQTSVFRNAEDFINEFNERFEKRHQEEILLEKDNSNNFQHKNDTYDIFISYPSEDYERVCPIVQLFKDMGASVWFDKVELYPGEKYEKSIIEKIQSCKRFVPILSEATLKIGRRFFKKEWKLAIEESEYHLNEPFISPILIDNIDIYSEKSIPKEFTKDTHVISFNDENIEMHIKKIIRSFR